MILWHLLIHTFFLADANIVNAPESKDIVLNSSKLATHCFETHWFKYKGPPRGYLQLAHLQKDKLPIYYGDFCFEDSSPCFNSPKLDMNNVTGGLTIRNAHLDDEDDYYYFCGDNEWPKYELLNLKIYGKKNIEIN